MANSGDLHQTAPIGAVCSGSTLLASILNSSVVLVNYLQRTTSANDIFKYIYFLCALRIKVPKTSDKPFYRRCLSHRQNLPYLLFT